VAAAAATLTGTGALSKHHSTCILANHHAPTSLSLLEPLHRRKHSKAASAVHSSTSHVWTTGSRCVSRRCSTSPATKETRSHRAEVHDSIGDDVDAQIIKAVGTLYDAGRIDMYFQRHPAKLLQHGGTAVIVIGGLALSAAAGLVITGLKTGMTSHGGHKDVLWSQLRKKLAPQIADALISLGPTFIKFGQALASRPDLVPPEICTELTRLQDALPPFDHGVARQILAQELEGSRDSIAASELLSSIKDAEPIAAASIGQVYKGFVDGDPVAVKVQRPSARSTAVADAALLRLLAQLVASLHVPPAFRNTDCDGRLVRADVVGAVDEFCSRLFEELDYHREADNLELFAALYGPGGKHAAELPAPGIRVPRLHRQLCSRRVLVMEWVDGERLMSGTPSTEQTDHSDLHLINLGIKATLSQLLDTGIMHTDPHGGNLLKVVIDGANEDNKYVTGRGSWSQPPEQQLQHQLLYLDFGLVAEVPLQVRDGLVCAVLLIVQKRWRHVASLFNQLMLLPDWVMSDEVQLQSFSQDLAAAAEKCLIFDDASVSDVERRVPSLRFAALLEQLVVLAPRYEFRLPPYFVNNARALGCLEGMARSADPNFNIMRSMYPFALRRLLSNPSQSPVVQRTLRLLVRDDATGQLSAKAALELADTAAVLQGVGMRSILADALRTKGGRALARDIIRGKVSKAVRRFAGTKDAPSEGTPVELV